MAVVFNRVATVLLLVSLLAACSGDPKHPVFVENLGQEALKAVIVEINGLRLEIGEVMPGRMMDHVSVSEIPSSVTVSWESESGQRHEENLSLHRSSSGQEASAVVIALSDAEGHSYARIE